MDNKVAIIGARNPSISYEDWKEKYQNLILSYSPEFIVSGGAKGIDFYAKKLSDDLNIPIWEFLPDYSSYGRNAPIVRNEIIVKNSDVIAAFPSESSKGTYDTVRKVKKLNKTVRVCLLK